MLSQAEINQFYDQGYVITGPMDLDLLERLRKASYIEVEKIGAAMPDRMPGSYNPQIQPGPFAEYLASPHVLDVIEDLLGTDIYGLSLHCRVGNFKDDQKMVWHRDGMAPHHTAEKEMEILTSSKIVTKGMLHLLLLDYTRRARVTPKGLLCSKRSRV